jgi:diaminopimelate decarboxylase
MWFRAANTPVRAPPACPGERIVFSGVGKTRAEMAQALAGGIRQFNVESEPELEALSEVAAGLGVEAPVALRLNPDVDARTHPKIATGGAETKFGIPMGQRRGRLYPCRRAARDSPGRARPAYRQPADRPCPLSRQAYLRLAGLTRAMRAEGHRIDRLDLGGGLGIPYTRSNAVPPLPSEYGALVRRIFGDLDCEIEIEPGRLIAGNAGILLAAVIYVKPGAQRRFPDPRRGDERSDPPDDV